MSLNIIKCNRGVSNLLLEGFQYEKTRSNKNGSVMRRCCQTKCESSVLTRDDTILKYRKCHDHKTDTGRNNAVALTNNIRKRYRGEPTPVMKIYEDEIKNFMMQGKIIATDTAKHVMA